MPHYDKMPISAVAAFLHMGEKYVIPSFIQEAKAKLRCNSDPTSIHSTSILPVAQLFPGIADGDPHFWKRWT